MDNTEGRVTHIQNIRFDHQAEKLYIIDQTLLPNKEREICVQTVDEMIDAIRTLKIRGAPAIGIFAGYCMYLLAYTISAQDPEKWLEVFYRYGDSLESARPTAVNLHWAVNRMERTARAYSTAGREGLLTALLREAEDIQKDDIEKCTAISNYGLELLRDGAGILTHCNAGPLATSRYGTALGPILLGAERGIRFHVFADETRPLLQGARLTTYELQRAGVDVTLICDSMASIVMQNGWIDACLVGCDRIAANGDTANKIGTSGVAVLAQYYGIPFYVLGPTSTIDMTCPTGREIPIELRDGEEIKSMFFKEPSALPKVKCYDPAFDVTDHTLITAIVTERGIIRPPFLENLKQVMIDN
jgi:methylthioribose-1-phosphate isomerase